MASGASNAASDAAEPPPEPPGMRVVSHGLWVGPYAECSVELPIANSSMFVLPRITTPALRSRAATVASYGGRHPSRIFEPQVVGMSEVASTSLSASGTPASGEAGSFPLASAASTSAAAASAGWVATCRKACTTGSTSVMRSRWAWVASTADTSRLWIFSANSAAVNRVSSALIARLRARSAPRSLALAAMLARCRLRSSVHQTPAGEPEEHVLQRGAPHEAGLRASPGPQRGAQRGLPVGGVEQHPVGQLLRPLDQAVQL